MKWLFCSCRKGTPLLTQEEFDDFMRKADAVGLFSFFCAFLLTTNIIQDGNGKLDYNEFVKVLLGYND